MRALIRELAALEVEKDAPQAPHVERRTRPCRGAGAEVLGDQPTLGSQMGSDGHGHKSSEEQLAHCSCRNPVPPSSTTQDQPVALQGRLGSLGG